MRSTIQLFFSLAACALLSAGCKSSSSCCEAPAKGKWTVLFDGTSTDAFRGYKRDTFPADCWKIENGTLTSFRGAKKPTDVMTKEKYGSFELECEWKISPGGNSGIIYHISEEFERSYMTGMEMQVLDDSKHKDGKNPKTSAGALYALIAPTNKHLAPVGEWNKVHLIVKGHHVEHWLNGSKVVEYESGSPELKALIDGSKFKQWPKFATIDEGYVAFQFHGDVASYRNIRIRRL